ncbi:MAG: hypothetical protein IPF54_01610 [Draconibacterium sp.]|nr:hypothetical protein [Draconibacterium sp.]
MGEGKVIAGPEGAEWRMWSEKDPNILYLMKRKRLQFIVSSWNRLTGKEEIITEFLVPEIGSYVEFKQFTSPGNIIVAFRETPIFLLLRKKKNARYIKLPTRLKVREYLKMSKL